MVVAHDDTGGGGGGGSFPTTHWSMLAEVRGTLSPAHRAVLNLLLDRYWKPVYWYIRRRGLQSEQAKDLVQEFFTSWLQRNLFGRADPSRGRFRSFLLSCLDNFLSNQRRAARAQHRQPPEGFLSIHQLATDARLLIEPVDRDTPEVIFDRTWVSELLRRVLNSFEQECAEAGRQSLFDVFKRRIIDPALGGEPPPSLAELGAPLGLTEKQVSNQIITARRAFQRLLREEVQAFAVSQEDAAAEVRDLFDLLAGA